MGRRPPVSYREWSTPPSDDFREATLQPTFTPAPEPTDASTPTSGSSATPVRQASSGIVASGPAGTGSTTCDHPTFGSRDTTLWTTSAHRCVPAFRVENVRPHNIGLPGDRASDRVPCLVSERRDPHPRRRPAYARPPPWTGPTPNLGRRSASPPRSSFRATTPRQPTPNLEPRPASTPASGSRAAPTVDGTHAEPRAHASIHARSRSSAATPRTGPPPALRPGVAVHTTSDSRDTRLRRRPHLGVPVGHRL
jgi:hypothetical protein